MALSNTMHGAPGKANGAGKSTTLTGLEFLTEGVDALGTPGKDGVDFSALMQGIIQPTSATPGSAPTLTASAVPQTIVAAPLSEANRSEQAPLPVLPSLSQSAGVAPEHEAPTQAAALLALALGNGEKAAPVAAPGGDVSPEAPEALKVQAEPVGRVTPHLVAAQAGKAASRRAAALEADKVGLTNGEGEPAEPKLTKDGERPSSDVSVAPAPVAQPTQTDGAPRQVPLVPQVVHAQVVPNDQNGTERVSGKERRSRAEGIEAGASARAGDLPRAQTLADKGTSQVANSAPKGVVIPPPTGTEPRAPEPEVRSFASEVGRQVSRLTDNDKTEKSDIGRKGSPPVDAEIDTTPLREPRERDQLAATSSVQASPGRGESSAQPASQTIPQISAPLPAVQLSTPASLSGSLGQQVVDMGISGQWIDDIARQIASISANPGHGSFRIASHELGAVQVDIAPASVGSGSDVVMRVDSDAAFAALNEDKDRLMHDARMASVRIGELRIDRLAPPQETARGDMNGNTQQQQNQASQQQGNSSSLSQNGAQMSDRGGQQQGRPDAASLAGQNQGGNNPKAPFTTTVMRGADADEANGPMRSGRGDSARYA